MTRRTIIAALLACAACSASPEEQAAALDAEILAHADAFVAAVRAGDVEKVKGFLTAESRRQLEATPDVDLVAMTRPIVGEAERAVELARHLPAAVPSVSVATPIPYTLSLPPLAGEGYVLLLTFPQRATTTVLELVYAKEADAWRLLYVDGGSLLAGGKRADAWLAEAKTFDAAGQLIPESVRLAAALQCARPVASFRYDFEDDLTAHVRTLIGKVEATIKFPAPLPGATKPSVYRIDATFDGAELLPLIHATTTIPLDDTQAIEVETARTEPELFALLPGLCTGVTRYAVQWYARPPLNPTRNYRRVGVVRPCP